MKIMLNRIIYPFLNIFLKYFKILSSFFLKLFDEKRFVSSVKVFPANIKSINPVQKYRHIIESYTCILKIFVMFLLLINFFISFGMCRRKNRNK